MSKVVERKRLTLPLILFVPWVQRYGNLTLLTPARARNRVGWDYKKNIEYYMVRLCFTWFSHMLLLSVIHIDTFEQVKSQKHDFMLMYFQTSLPLRV